MKKSKLLLLLIIATILFITECADVTAVDQCVNNDPYGFWSGLWHGFIMWFSLIGSAFSNNIAVYGVNNTGGWYDFGFVLGISISYMGGALLTRK